MVLGSMKFGCDYVGNHLLGEANITIIQQSDA